MKKFSVLFLSVFLLLGIGETASAAPLDLSSWSALTLDFAGGQPAGNFGIQYHQDSG